MKQIKILLIMSVFLGCAKLPEVPPVNLSGVMNVKIIEPGDFAFDGIRGFFSVEGEKNKFTIYFQDIDNVPRGRITVQGKKVRLEGIEFDRNILKLFKYWAYIFGFGAEGRNSFQLGDVVINYSDWKKLNGKKYPSVVILSAPEFVVNINIYYGNKSAGKN